MILAAGEGTRLRPLTYDCPKCMMPLAGSPLIDWVLRWIKHAGVQECVINLHYLPDMVKEFVGDGDGYGLGIHYSYEPELLGTAGAVKKVADFFNEPFYVIYSDNFCQWDLKELKEVFRGEEERQAAGIVAIHWQEDVTQSGMVELDGDNRILHLVEKPGPEIVTSHYVSSGFFYLDPKVFDYIPENGFCDFGFHVFPAMLQAGEGLYAVKMDKPLIGIDTVEAYKKANEWALKMRGEE